jgi:hypothetical protein
MIYIYIYICSVEHSNVFNALVATSFGHYGHHQTNAIQNFKKAVTCGAHKCQVVWDPIYINVTIY